MIMGKVWGRTQVIADTPFFALHLLEIQPHTQCSLHAHKNKHNGFFVCEGVLKIEVHKQDYALVDVTELSQHEFTNVKPGEYHRFINDSDYAVTALEWYSPEPLSEDIVRKNCGGRTSAAKRAALRVIND